MCGGVGDLILLAAGSEQAQMDLYNTIQGMNAMMNNNSIQILGENDSFETHQYTFGGIADTYDRFMMDVAGAAEPPVTKLFGRSLAGMNATGESDMQNYYDTIEEKQESILRPIYDKLLPIMAMSALGAVPDGLDFEFNAVRRPDEDEMSDLASKNTNSVTITFQAGLISQRTALKELRSQSEITGMWTNTPMRTSKRPTTPYRTPTRGWRIWVACSAAKVRMPKKMSLETEKKLDRIKIKTGYAKREKGPRTKYGAAWNNGCC